MSKFKSTVFAFLLLPLLPLFAGENPASPSSVAKPQTSNLKPQTSCLKIQAETLGTPVVHDGYLYLTASSEISDTILVFDLKKPGEPLFAGSTETDGAALCPPQFLGDTAFLLTENGIQIFDATRPENITPVRTLESRLDPTDNGTARIADEHLIVATSESTRIYDISNPFEPVLTDSTTLEPYADFPFSGTYLPAFAAGTNAIFRIRDGRFTDCGPVNRGTNGIPDAQTWVSAKFVTDKIAYITAHNADLCIADFTDPVKPDITFVPDFPEVLAPQPKTKGHIYACGKNAREICDISVWKPLDPHHSRTITFPDDIDIGKLTFNGPVCYAASDEVHALRTYSVSATNAVCIAEIPFLCDFETLPSTSERFINCLCKDSVTNRYFTVDGLSVSVLRFGDGTVSNEAVFPLTKNSVYGPQAIAAAGGENYLVASGADGLKLFHYNGTNLVQKALCETGGFARDVAFADGMVFVADDARGVTSVTLKDGVLTKLRTHSLPVGTANAVAVKNGKAFVAAGECPIAVLSKTKPLPAAVRPESSYKGNAQDIALFDRDKKTYALIADFENGIALYDVTDSDHPAFVSSLASLARNRHPRYATYAIYTDGTYAYALDGFREGVLAVKLDFLLK